MSGDAGKKWYDWVTISDGPSKYDLLVGLGERHRRRTVTFSGAISGSSFTIGAALFEINALVDGISIEDGSGESWVITVSLVNGIPSLGSSTRLSGHYSTKTRKGSLKIAK